jgi:predicted  nucleic acid-binding Zn-ribbon protein
MALFNRRASMLEVQNRALINTVRESAERIDKLERELRRERERQAENDRLKAEREFFSHRIAELEEENRQLTESATKYSLWGQKLERELTEAVTKHQKLERELTESATKYSLWAQKLERELTEALTKHQKLERELTESATKYSLWGQKLERELNRIDPDGTLRRRFGAQHEE